MEVVSGGIEEQTVSVDVPCHYPLCRPSIAQMGSSNASSWLHDLTHSSLAAKHQANPQTQVFKNMSAVLSASGATPASILKTTVFLKSMNDFVAFNKIYVEFFGQTKPARSCVEVARLPKDVLVEIE